MPRGNADETDQELIHKLSKFERPVTINDLVERLNWSRGKIDGSVTRLVEKKAIAVVNISKPKGQRQRFIGLPERAYWASFYEQYIIDQRAILIYDTLDVVRPFITEDTVSINHTRSKTQDFSEGIDPQVADVIKSELIRITKIAEEREISSAQFLKTGLQQILDPNFDFLARIALVVINESQSDINPDTRAVAQLFLEQASSLD